jgi:hypothetical protein
MSNITISNLPLDQALDREAMSAVRGGTGSWMKSLGSLGGFANVNVGVDVSQNINQFQRVDVNTLNNVGSIGPGFGPLAIDVEPKQLAKASAIF